MPLCNGRTLEAFVEIAKLIFGKLRVPVFITSVVLALLCTSERIAPAILVSAQPYISIVALFLAADLLYDQIRQRRKLYITAHKRQEQLSEALASLSRGEKRLLEAALESGSTTIYPLVGDFYVAVALRDKGIVREVPYMIGKDTRSAGSVFIIEDDAWEYLKTFDTLFPDGDR